MSIIINAIRSTQKHKQERLDMKFGRIGTATVTVLLGVFLQSTNVFAENYGIEYIGGEPLSADNVRIEPDLLSGLTRVGYGKGVQLTLSDSSLWKSAYIKEDDYCREVPYIEITGNGFDESLENVYATFTRGSYSTKIDIKNVFVERSAIPEGYFYALTIDPYIEVGFRLYVDNGCTEMVENLAYYGHKNLRDVFVETNISLHKNGKDEPFTANDLYFGLTDIDAGQSYRILNPDNMLTPENMFASSAEYLNGDDPDSPLKNRYVADGKYIYSEINGRSYISTANLANIAVRIGEEAQRQGLNMVYGYTGSAGSGALFYAKQYVIEYASDENGLLTGIEKEAIISGDMPSGSTTVPVDNYMFDYWVADKDVALENGDVIGAGNPIAPEQVKQVVVTDNITFTAIHSTVHYEITYVSDDNGKIIGIKSEDVDIDGNPTGSTSAPDKNYEFGYWIADKDVTLENGEIISAGDPITSEQIRQVVITEDITFTAIHKRKADVPDNEDDDPSNINPEIEVPNSGFFTGGISVVVTVSVIGIVLTIALVTGSIPKIVRKRVDFDK